MALVGLREGITTVSEVMLFLGNCLEFMKTLKAKNVDAVVTDPPYGINANKMTLGAGRKNFYRGGEWDSETVDISWLFKFGEFHCLWGGNYYAKKLPENNRWLVWHKLNDNRSFSEFEMAWTDFVPNARIYQHRWSEKKCHPTQKPLALMKWCLSFLPEGITVFDPFMGSGTTGVACIQTGRNFIGCEIDPQYFAIAEKRINDAKQHERLPFGKCEGDWL